MTDADRNQRGSDAFRALCVSALDGTIDANGLAELEGTLRADAEAQRHFVRLAQLVALLERREAVVAERDEEPAAEVTSVRPATMWGRWAIAAGLLVAGCVAALAAMSLAPQGATEHPQPAGRPMVATIVDAAGGATVVVNDGIGERGSVYGAGTYAIESGEAELLLTNRVGVKLSGATMLDIHGPMSATLAHGTAEFDCPPRAKGYTVATPGGIRVTDLGTRFGVDVRTGGAVTVHVIEGAVEAHDANGGRVDLTAGQIGVAGDGVTLRLATAMLAHHDNAKAQMRSNGVFTVGSLIEVGEQAMWVTHLGVQDTSSAGLADDGFHGGRAIPVGIWDERGEQLLASVEVAPTSPLMETWRYAAIAGGPVRLDAGARYRIGALVGGGIEWFIDGDRTAAFTPAEGVRLVESVYHEATFAAPMSTGSTAVGRWGAANALLVPADDAAEHQATPAGDAASQEKRTEADPSQEQEL